MSSGKLQEEIKKGKIAAKDKEKQNEDKLKFDTIVKTYLDEITKAQTSESSLKSSLEPELEVRFGTMKHSAPLTKDNVTNIIKKLKSLQFQKGTEEYSLRIFLNDSDARVQIDGFSNIQNFCIDNAKLEKMSANKSFRVGSQPVKILGIFAEPHLRTPIIRLELILVS